MVIALSVKVISLLSMRMFDKVAQQKALILCPNVLSYFVFVSPIVLSYFVFVSPAVFSFLYSLLYRIYLSFCSNQVWRLMEEHRLNRIVGEFKAEIKDWVESKSREMPVSAARCGALAEELIALAAAQVRKMKPGFR